MKYSPFIAIKLDMKEHQAFLRIICLSVIIGFISHAVPAIAGVANVSVGSANDALAFFPATTNISLGDTVIWTWPVGAFDHNVVSSSEPEAWTASPLENGPFAFTNVFTNAGTFPYLCTFHGFTGSIIVSSVSVSAPMVSITAPANGSIFSAPASFTLTATTSDSGGGTITNVQFLQGSTLLGNVASAPFSIAVSNLSAADYTFSAVATDNTGLTATNSITIQVTPPVTPPVIGPTVAITNPANGSTLSAPASFTLAATVSDSSGTVTNVEFLQGATLLGNITSAPFSVLVSNLSAASYTFSAIATDNTGLTASNSITINVAVGSPVIFLGGNLAFGGVAVGSTASNTLTISNSGKTTLNVTNITYPAGFAGAFSGPIAPGGTQSVSVTFSPTAATTYGGTVTVVSDASSGVNTIPLSGFGASGNSTLAIIINGSGTVSPNLNGKALKPGLKYRITAVPGSGEVFSSWSGSVNTNQNPLTFTMETSTVLQANFVPNPFLAAEGTYNGLFSATNGVTEDTAGMLSDLTIKESGTYSGALIIAGQKHTISGAFSLSGQATNHITGARALALEMSLVTSSNSGPQIIGTVAGSDFVATLLADRASGVLPSGQYTMLIPPAANSPQESPGGAGYAAIANQQGTIKITGALADGTVLGQSVTVSEDGYVPVFSELYAGKGLLLGWINLALTNATNVGLTWIHPAVKTGLYQAGFTNSVPANQVLISPWSNDPADFGLLTTLTILDTIGDTNDASAVTKSVSIDASGRVTGSSVSGSVNLKTGMFKVTTGRGSSAVTGSGAILLNQTFGGGYFLTKTNAQAVELSP